MRLWNSFLKRLRTSRSRSFLSYGTRPTTEASLPTLSEAHGTSWRLHCLRAEETVSSFELSPTLTEVPQQKKFTKARSLSPCLGTSSRCLLTRTPACLIQHAARVQAYAPRKASA